MSVISLILLLSQLIYAAPSYSCDWSGYDDYLAYYKSKCGTDCEEYKKYHTAYLSLNIGSIMHLTKSPVLRSPPRLSTETIPWTSPFYLISMRKTWQT